MKRLVLLSVLVLAAVAGGVFAVKRWYVAAFPDLPPGVYGGSLRFDGSKKEVPWLVFRRSGEQSLAVAVGLVTVSAQRVAPIDPVSGARQPLFVGGADVRLRLTGDMAREGHYEGVFLNPISQERGKWMLHKSGNLGVSPEKEADLTRWYSLWQELEQIEGEIQISQRKIDDQSSSIENLRRVVSEGDVLRKTADVRLGRADSEMEAAVDELRIRQEQLDRKLRDFDLTQRVSQEGRLVFLSRETIQRESRWIELTLNLLAPETSIGFDQALERAERVKKLREAIAKEREVRAARSLAESPVERGRESHSEEEFYEHLR
jgi:hypothetical protein